MTRRHVVAGALAVAFAGTCALAYDREQSRAPDPNPTPEIVFTKVVPPCALEYTIPDNGKVWWICKSGLLYSVDLRK